MDNSNLNGANQSIITTSQIKKDVESRIPAATDSRVSGSYNVSSEDSAQNSEWSLSFFKPNLEKEYLKSDIRLDITKRVISNSAMPVNGAINHKKSIEPEDKIDLVDFIETKHSSFLIVQLFCLLHYFDILDASRKYQTQPCKRNIALMVVSALLGVGKLFALVSSYMLTAISFVSILGVSGFGWPILILIGIAVAGLGLLVKVILTKSTNEIHKSFAKADQWLQNHPKTRTVIFILIFLPIVALYTISKIAGNPTLIGFYTADIKQHINPSLKIISPELYKFFNVIHHTVEFMRVAYSVLSIAGFGFALCAWTGLVDVSSVVSFLNTNLPSWLAGFITKIPTLPDFLLDPANGAIGIIIISLNLIWSWLKFLLSKHVIDANNEKIIRVRSRNLIGKKYSKKTIAKQILYRKRILLAVIEELTHRIKINSYLLEYLEHITEEDVMNLKIDNAETTCLWLFKILRKYPFNHKERLRIEKISHDRNDQYHEETIKAMMVNIIHDINDLKKLL